MQTPGVPRSAAYLVFALAILLCGGRTAQTEPASEPAPPTASAAAAPLLGEAEGLGAAGKWEEALKTAERALAAARAGGDGAGEALAHAARARALAAAGQPAEAAEAWQQAAAQWGRLGAEPEQIQALAAAGLLALDQRRDPGDLFSRALALGKGESKRPLGLARELEVVGRECYDRGFLEPARLFWEAGLSLQERFAPDALQTALCLNNLGVVAWRRRETEKAESLLRRALTIREKLAPDSLDVATTLNNLGLVAHTRRDLITAKQLHGRALAIQEKLVPDSMQVATSLNNLGGVAQDESNLLTAATYYRRALAIQEVRAPVSFELAALLSNLASLAEHQGDIPAAQGYQERALAIREKLEPGTIATAQTLNQLANLVHRRGQLAAAEGYYARALAIVEREAPGSTDVAALLLNLGSLASDQGELAEAEGYLRRATRLYEQNSPRSLELAASLDRLGNVLIDQGAFHDAGSFHRRARDLRAELAPHSLEMAASLDALATVAEHSGELTTAARDEKRALALREKLAPASVVVAVSLDHLASVARLQGDLKEAADLYGRALALFEQTAPNSLHLATCLNNIGGLARQQRDLEAAREYYQRSLAIRQRLAPDALPMATLLDNLGAVVHDQGDPAGALQYHRRALALFERKAPNSIDLATTLNNIGDTAITLGDLPLATSSLQHALTLFQRMLPDSLMVATILDNLGVVARRKGDLAAAGEYHSRALRLYTRVAPRSPELAGCLWNLGALARMQRNWVTAESLWRRAWEMTRTEATALTGDEALQSFGASTAQFATALIEAQLALGKTDAAFRTLEESRAHAMRQLLAERRLDDVGAPPALRAAHQKALEARDRAEQALSEASAAEAVANRKLAAATEEANAATPPQELRAASEAARRQSTAAQSEYVQARVKADQLWAAIQRNSPRAYLPPLSPRQARSVLPAGCLYLAFSVGPDQTQVFVLGAKGDRTGAPSVFRVPLAASELQKLVQQLRSRVTDPEADAAETAAAGRALFARLFPPQARAGVVGARRLLISPDGPLWDAPFAALVTNAQGSPRYLAEQTAITYAQSLTLFAQSRQDRPRLAAGGAAAAVVVGDPLFDRAPARLAAAPAAPSLVRSERSFLFRDGSPPAPLPGTRVEAAAIAKLYGSAPLLAGRATEAELRRQIVRADVVHLATHGYLDARRPMSSGVLLTVPDPEPAAGQTADDGVLQAWEIYSQLKLRAELVVLSACETGRGRTVAGEGIVGLTRALQFAGARSIIASQWKVSDASTRALMVAFHQKLRQGVAKDEALRQAMAVVRRDPRTAPPYYWAAFFLTGDPANPAPATTGGGGHPRRISPRRGRGE